MLINIQRLGEIDFGAALKLQNELVAQRAADKITHTLLLLEHPHTYTVGNGGHREQLRLS
jgi:lipoyl(octanoyl) transferase